VMRPEALREATAKAAARLRKMRTRLATGEKQARKRMATLVTVTGAEPAPRRPHDIIAPPGGRDGTRALRPGPKARGKWLAGSVRRDPGEVITAAFDEAGARDSAHLRTWIVLVDGAEHQLTLIRAEASRRGAAIHIIIDIIHVLEYLWGCARALHAAGDPAAENWVAARALQVLAGHSDLVAEEITAEADAAALTPGQRTSADACVRYLTGKNEYLRYDQALEAGWPIATGVIEGACRQRIVADRLDIGGARWGLDGAEAVLTLRAVISSRPRSPSCSSRSACCSPAASSDAIQPAISRKHSHDSTNAPSSAGAYPCIRLLLFSSGLQITRNLREGALHVLTSGAETDTATAGHSKLLTLHHLRRAAPIEDGLDSIMAAAARAKAV
jgi:hypothetical protein